MLLAIDPGEGTGWATISKTGNVIETGITRDRDQLYAILEIMPDTLEIVIMEDFRLFSHKAIQQSGSTLETVRVIGAVDSWAHLRGLPVILQPASILPIARLWTGIKAKGAHKNNHHVSAMLHGLYWLQKNGHIKPERRD